MDDIIKKVHEKLSDLEKASTYDFRKTKETFSLLDKIFREHYRNAKTMEKICEIMLEHNFLKIAIKISKQISKNVKDEELFQDVKCERHAFMLVKSTIWNYSDRCYELCRECYNDSDLIFLLMDELRLFASDLKKLDDSGVRHHIKADFGILHNLLRQYEGNKDHVSFNDGLKVLSHYARSEYLIIRALSYFVSAYCTTKNEPNSLLPHDEVLEFMLKLLNGALASENHRSEHGLSASEVTEAIDMLAINDSNQEKLVDLGVLTPLVKMLDDQAFSEDEILKSLRCIWTLTLNDYSKDAVLQESNLIDKLKRLRVKENESRDWRANLIYTLTPHSKPVRRHVMLSYQWDSQALVIQLHDYLVQQGFKVWMDINEMKGSINDCMAEAVENSAIVIMLVTQKYNESRQTKKEVQYADERDIPLLPVILEAGYKSHKWLGLLMAGKLYVDIPVSQPTSKFSNVKKQILALVPELKQSLSKPKK